MTGFSDRARLAVQDVQLRRNIRKASETIRAKTARVTSELPDWEALRVAGRAIKQGALAELDRWLVLLEESVTRAGGRVHWARDAAEARAIVIQIADEHAAKRVIKVKSMTTDEIALNPALAAAGIEPIETDLADMIVQLAGEKPSHLLVPAIHKNRNQIRDLFRERIDSKIVSDQPEELALAARSYLRAAFLDVKMAISGANFAAADTGTIAVVESEGNGRMCLTLPDVLVTIMGIEKVLPRFQDLEVFLQLLPRAATGERMNPYTSLWTGVRPGDGPQEFHLVLLDNGRSKILADEVARETLHCIRCSRCLNVCPVFERVGGHAYDSMYQGPIGAILTPQLNLKTDSDDLPFASTLCGACKEACPVNIDIPRILVHLRAQVVSKKQARAFGGLDGEALAMKAALMAFSSPPLYEMSLGAARILMAPFIRDGRAASLPGPFAAWTLSRDFPEIADEDFRSWWAARDRS